MLFYFDMFVPLLVDIKFILRSFTEDTEISVVFITDRNFFGAPATTS